ncbi:MAG: ZIP family metal transporter [Candidatus Wildermuthbacteria bacterium]|nr:ZIP family metal transporter [Candidatus Wildermuthbacteria bacterium]
MQQIIFSIAAFFSIFLGGLLAIRLKEKLHLIMAFAAGVLLGVVSFDIFPEIIEQIKIYDLNPTAIMVALVAGFLLFHILEKTILIHYAHEVDYAEHKHPQVGVISALALIGHSLIDGVSIGLGFQVNASVGALVAIAVISHGFTDGINNVTFMLNHKNSVRKSKTLLFLHSLAPILGTVSTLFFSLPPQFLVLYLGFFAGFLLYIGASDILPEAHSKQSSFKLIGLTVLGVIFIFVVTRLA